MIRVLIFKLKTWYAKAKVEYAESKIMQTMYFTPIRKRNGLPDSFLGTATPGQIPLTTEEVIARVKAYQDKKVSKI